LILNFPTLVINDAGLLREELEKVSKQLAEQRALVATLEVEITTVLQERKIQELDYKSHVQQYVIINSHLLVCKLTKTVKRLNSVNNFSLVALETNEAEFFANARNDFRRKLEICTCCTGWRTKFLV